MDAGKSKHCLNCGNIVEGNFCSNCGQSVHVSRINPKHVAEELQYGLLHVNKGMIFTIKELIINPGPTIKNYIGGKRVKYTKPFLFLIVIGLIYSLIFHFFHYFPMEEMNNRYTPIYDYIPLQHWYSAHYSLMLLCLIPFYSLSTYWFFRRQKYNYVEHLVLFSYLTGAKIFILLLFYPAIYLTRSAHLYQIVQLVSEAYLIWGLVQFFKTTSWMRSVLKVISCIILVLVILLVLVYLLYLMLRYYDLRL